MTAFWFVSAGSDQGKQCGVKKNQNGKKIAPMYTFLPLVRTKASELSNFPGVNTPLISCFQL